MSNNSSQKFIARNRAPRVQIEYDVEIYGSEKKIELPFVMGVLADLSGKSTVPPTAVADRKFLDIDIDNFDERMKAIQPRVAFAVPNTLSDSGQLMVDITFESIDDFSPAAVARKVEPLRQLLEARTQLSNLQTYTVEDLEFDHYVDRSSPNLMKYCLTGKHIPEAVLTVRKAGGTPLEYLKLSMTDVIITGVRPSGTNSDDVRVRERVRMTAQGSTFRIDGSGFSFRTPASHHVWAATHQTFGPDSIQALLPELPRSECLTCMLNAAVPGNPFTRL